MIGIDTNILVRFLTADDAAQYQKAVKLFETETIFIADSVFLETEWVLRYTYDYDCAQVCEGFRRVIGLDTVEVSNAYFLEAVIMAHETGMDFADALHWIGNQHCSDFLNFDRKFVNRARQLSHQLKAPFARELV